jgi:hypothetical protein
MHSLPYYDLVLVLNDLVGTSIHIVVSENNLLPLIWKAEDLFVII